MKMRLLLTLLAATGLPATAGVLFPATDQPATAGRRDPPTPWHLVDVWWDVGRDVPFESYAVDVDVGDDVPPSSRLYLAPIGLGHLGKTPFYGGLQTQADGHTRRDPRLRRLGPGFLFSRWGERDLAAIRPSLGGFCQSSGHEGDFISVRRPQVWEKGRYTYRVVRMDREEVGGQPCTWVGAFVYAHAKDENLFVGALRFPGENLVLARKVASFVEVYGPRIPPADIPRLTVTFGNLRVNGRPVDSPTAVAVYPKGVPDYAEAAAKDGSVVITVGRHVAGRQGRTVPLLGR